VCVDARAAPRRTSESAKNGFTTTTIIARTHTRVCTASMVNAVGERFAAVAAKHPDAMAVIGSHRTLSFAELLCASSKLASRLENEYHMEQQSLIALHLERSCLMVKSIMGVVLAQGCYVPVDTTLPEQRKLAILGDSHPVAIICTKASAALLPGAYHQPRQVCIIGMELPVPLSNLRSAALITPSSQDALNQDATDSTSSNGSSSGTESTGRPVKTRRADVPSPLLYVFYTSGSTGRPKGVMVEHAALCHRIDWLQSHHPLTPSEDRVLQKTSYGFGISEWEIFWPLLTGATMVLARAEGQKDPAYLYERVLTTHTTTAFFVPSALDAFLDEADQPLPALRYIFCCGEPLQPALCQRVHAPASGIDVLMCNLYGPTEADMTAWYVPQRNSEELAQLKTVPIGRPIDGCNLLLVEAETEDALKLVAPGALGEICFDSVGTMRGYLHQQALTAAVVFASPSGAGRRVFRTGDLGRYRDDGTLEFHGRKDRQVKVRGIRIELGEVEAALVACNHVKEARVMVDGDGASKRLVAYVAPDTLPIALIEAQVRERLPAAYVPSCFMTLAALPRNVNGKVDTGALPPPSSMLSSADTVVQPRTKTEIRIAEIWATVLRTQVDKLSLTRDFDASGGNSLLAGKVTGLLRKAYPNARIEGTAVYVNASIEKLAMHVEERVAEAQAGGVKGSTPPPSATSGYKGYDNCGCVALLWQTAVVLFMNLPDLITNLLEIYLYRLLTFALLASSHTFGAVVLFLLKLAVAIGVSYALHFLEVALSIIVNFIAFPFGIREGRYPLWGWTHMRWWAAEKVQTAFGGFAAYGGTPLAPFIMRRFGCKVGVEAMIHGTVDMGGAAASLITIGDHVTIQYGASINPVAVENGELIVRRVDIGDHSEIGCRAVITPGSTLPSFTRLQSNCSSESGAFRGCITPREPVPPISTLQKCLRLFVGLPINDIVAALLTVMSFALLDLALVPLYNAGGITMPSGTSILGHLLGIREVGPVVVTPQYVGTLLLGVMLVAFIFAFSHSEGLFLFVVALKFCVLGCALRPSRCMDIQHFAIPWSPSPLTRPFSLLCVQTRKRVMPPIPSPRSSGCGYSSASCRVTILRTP
jgi:amino acid adenylation domain-containing protein